MTWWGALVTVIVLFVISFSCGWAMARDEWPWQSWRRR